MPLIPVPDYEFLGRLRGTAFFAFRQPVQNTHLWRARHGFLRSTTLRNNYALAEFQTPLEFNQLTTFL